MILIYIFQFLFDEKLQEQWRKENYFEICEIISDL